jgi:hypothetical protein
MLTARKTAIAATFASFLVFAMQAQSQEPAPSPGETGKPEQAGPRNTENRAGNDQKNAKPLPIVINVLAPQKTEAEATEERREREEKAQLDRRLVDLTKDVAIFTGGLFAATIALFLATGALWWSTRRLVKGAEETTERQLRAYIYVLPISLNHLDPTSFISFLFLQINVGKTPAYKATQSGVISIENHPLRPNFPFPTLPHTGRSRMLIGPGVRPQATILATLQIGWALQAPQHSRLRLQTSITKQTKVKPISNVTAPACRRHLKHGRQKVKLRIIAQTRSRFFVFA